MPIFQKKNNHLSLRPFCFQMNTFSFHEFYSYVKERGYVLYPGKLTDEDSFRIGNIGEIYQEDIEDLCNIIEEYMGVRTR